MYKQRLHELCQKKQWAKPLYTSSWIGPDHIPRFQASVTVNGVTFDGPKDVLFGTQREAQNEAARLAVDELVSSSSAAVTAAPPSPRPLPEPSSSSPEKLEVDENPSRNEELKNLRPDVVALNTDESGSSPEKLEVDENPSRNGESKKFGPEMAALNMDESGSLDAKTEIDRNPSRSIDSKEIQHMYKGLLQNYAQRRGLGMPAYDNESMGMDQATCFKASVTVGGQTFKSPQFFSLLKDAEHAAAKVAMEFFLPEGNLEEEGRFYKNLLCEMTQKEGLALPVYDTVSDGPSHMPTFASRVEIEGERFQGSVMKTKKQAEDDAAKVAWTRLRERKLSRFSSRFQVIKINDVSPSLPPPLPSQRGHQDDPLSDDAAQRKNQSDPPGGADISNSSKLAEEIGGGGEPVPGSYGRRDPSSPRSRGDDEISSASASVQGKCEFTASEKESSTSAIRVIVCPRKNNSQLPAGARLLPFSDDRWMAVRIE